MSETIQGVPEDQLRPFRIEDVAPESKVFGLLGLSESGKTVFSSVLAHILPKFYKKTRIMCTVEDGQQIVEEAIRKLTVERDFPAKTQPGTIRSLELKLSRQGRYFGRFGKKEVLLHVSDVSGDSLGDLARGMGGNPRTFFLTRDRQANQTVGPYAFLLYSKSIGLTIDCAEAHEWESRQYAYEKLLSSLVLAQGTKKLGFPLAVIFTKGDMLPKEKENASAMELLSEMHALRNYAVDHFGEGNVQAFKVSVEIERNVDGTPKTRKIKRVSTRDGKEVRENIEVHIPKFPLEVNEDGFEGFAEWVMNSL